MPKTTLNKASKCPKCNNYGELVKKAPTTDHSLTGYVYKCMHKLCLWYDTTWIVTADEDDKVEMMDIGHTAKLFPKRKAMSDADRKRLREMFDDEL